MKDLQHRARTIRSKINSNKNNYPEYIQAGIEGNNLIIKNYSGQGLISDKRINLWNK